MYSCESFGSTDLQKHAHSSLPSRSLLILDLHNIKLQTLSCVIVIFICPHVPRSILTPIIVSSGATAMLSPASDRLLCLSPSVAASVAPICSAVLLALVVNPSLFLALLTPPTCLPFEFSRTPTQSTPHPPLSLWFDLAEIIFIE